MQNTHLSLVQRMYRYSITDAVLVPYSRTAVPYYSSTYGLSIRYFRTITYTCMHACARALHDAVNASTPVERNFLQLVWVQKLGWGRRFLWLVLLQKVQSKYRYGGWYQYCTVEIPTEMEFTGTFQNYLQCANRT